MKLQKPPIGILPKKFSTLGTEERIKEIFQAMDRYLEAKICPPIRWLYELDELFQKVKAKQVKDAERKIAFRVEIDGIVYFRDEFGKWQYDGKLIENSRHLEVTFQKYLNEMFNIDVNMFGRACGKMYQIQELNIQKNRYLHHNPDVWGGIPAPSKNHFHNKVGKYLVDRQGEVREELSCYPEMTFGIYGRHEYEQQWRGQISDVTNGFPPPSEEYYQNKLLKKLEDEAEQSKMSDFGLHKQLMEIGKVKSVVACDGPTFKEWFEGI